MLENSWSGQRNTFCWISLNPSLSNVQRSYTYKWMTLKFKVSWSGTLFMSFECEHTPVWLIHVSFTYFIHVIDRWLSGFLKMTINVSGLQICQILFMSFIKSKRILTYFYDGLDQICPKLIKNGFSQGIVSIPVNALLGWPW